MIFLVTITHEIFCNTALNLNDFTFKKESELTDKIINIGKFKFIINGYCVKQDNYLILIYMRSGESNLLSGIYFINIKDLKNPFIEKNYESKEPILLDVILSPLVISDNFIYFRLTYADVKSLNTIARLDVNSKIVKYINGMAGEFILNFNVSKNIMYMVIGSKSDNQYCKYIEKRNRNNPLTEEEKDTYASSTYAIGDLYMLDNKTSESRLLAKDVFKEFDLYDGKFYYITQNRKFYKYDMRGSKKTKIADIKDYTALYTFKILNDNYALFYPERQNQRQAHILNLKTGERNDIHITGIYNILPINDNTIALLSKGMVTTYNFADKKIIKQYNYSKDTFPIYVVDRKIIMIKYEDISHEKIKVVSYQTDDLGQ